MLQVTHTAGNITQPIRSTMSRTFMLVFLNLSSFLSAEEIKIPRPIHPVSSHQKLIVNKRTLKQTKKLHYFMWLDICRSLSFFQKNVSISFVLQTHVSCEKQTVS